MSRETNKTYADDDSVFEDMFEEDAQHEMVSGGEGPSLPFVKMFEDYYRYSTDAPESFSEILGIQLLGHALGYNAVHLIRPKAVHHNMYSLLCGKSTLSRKSTCQELARDVYPLERSLPEETSPEQLIVELSENPEQIHWMGEFTSILKGISQRSYMSRSVELYNDLHGCPRRYARKIRIRKGEPNEFIIENAYLSANSTVTAEMLKENLTSELIEGGFLARWLIVEGVPNPKPRERLRPDILRLSDNIREILEATIQMDKSDACFVFDDEALKRFNAIENEAYGFDKVLPFAGRYLNYVVAIADILLVSDAIGKAIAKGRSLYTIKTLKELIQLIQLTKEAPSGVSRDNPANYIIVSKDYVERAWKIVKPCLAYVSTLVDYVEMEKSTARLMEYLKKVGQASHSKAMQYTHNSAEQMKKAVPTLVQMGYVQVINEEIERTGAGSVMKTEYKWIGPKVEHPS